MQAADFVTPTERLFDLICTVSLNAIVSYVDVLAVAAGLQKGNESFLVERGRDCGADDGVGARDDVIEVLTVSGVDVDFGLKAEECVLGTRKNFNILNFLREMPHIGPSPVLLLLSLLWGGVEEQLLSGLIGPRLDCLADAHEDDLLRLALEDADVVLRFVLESKALERLRFVFIILFFKFHVALAPWIVEVSSEAALSVTVLEAVSVGLVGVIRRWCPVDLLDALERGDLEL